MDKEINPYSIRCTTRPVIIWCAVWFAWNAKCHQVVVYVVVGYIVHVSKVSCVVMWRSMLRIVCTRYILRHTPTSCLYIVPGTIRRTTEALSSCELPDQPSQTAPPPPPCAHAWVQAGSSLKSQFPSESNITPFLRDKTLKFCKRV